MTDKQKEKDNKKHIAEQFELNLTNLPPKWTVIENAPLGFNYLNDKGDIELVRPKDDETSRKYCWAIYRKIER